MIIKSKTITHFFLTTKKPRKTCGGNQKNYQHFQTSNKIIHADTKYQDFLDNPALQRFFFSPTGSEEIELIITSLSNKSNGPANISTSMYKMFKKKPKTPLGNLVNFFECSAFLKILKIVMITRIYKRDGLLLKKKVEKKFADAYSLF